MLKLLSKIGDKNKVPHLNRSLLNTSSLCLRFL